MYISVVSVFIQSFLYFLQPSTAVFSMSRNYILKHKNFLKCRLQTQRPQIDVSKVCGCKLIKALEPSGVSAIFSPSFQYFLFFLFLAIQFQPTNSHGRAFLSQILINSGKLLTALFIALSFMCERRTASSVRIRVRN